MTDRFHPRALLHPIVQAPLAGGPGTVALAAAVSDAGGLGFLDAGYRSAAAVREDLCTLHALAGRPYGVNLFVLHGPAADPLAYGQFVDRLQAVARGYGVSPGQPVFDDDGWEDKLRVLHEVPAPVVSFTFGCPAAEVIASLQAAGSAVWVTVTSPQEAGTAQSRGADALVVQGIEAGGHRAVFDDGGEDHELSLLPLLQLLGRGVRPPLIAAGGIATGAGVAAVLCAGAVAAQVGTAFLRTHEAATAPVHRRMLAEHRPTRLTRAFTGRTARSIRNRFVDDHSAGAASAYPEVHHVTAPLRRAGRERDDAEVVNLWAGQSYGLTEEMSAGDLVRRLSSEASRALTAASSRLEGDADQVGRDSTP